MKELTEKQQAVLDFIKEYLKVNGRPPSYQDICDYFDWSSPNAAAAHVKFLEKKGAIEVDRGITRGIRVL